MESVFFFIFCYEYRETKPYIGQGLPSTALAQVDNMNTQKGGWRRRGEDR